MRFSPRALLVVAAVVAGAVAHGACGGDDDESSAEVTPDGSLPTGDSDGSVSDDAGTGNEDGSTPGDAAPPPPPTYCNGIVLYATFDQGFVPERGAGPVRALGNVQTVPGKFGNASAFVANPDAGVDGGAMLFLDKGDAGAIVYPKSEGTIAFWFRRKAAPSAVESFLRPLGDGTAPAGLAFTRQAARLGVHRTLGGPTVLSSSVSELAPYVRDDAFNHYAHGWRAANDAGATSLVMLAFNGATGEVLSDAGADAASYADASFDDAGNFVTPFKAITTNPWPTYEELVTLRLGGTVATTMQGEVDDFVVWNRVLSFEELAELYRRNEPLSTTCP